MSKIEDWLKKRAKELNVKAGEGIAIGGGVYAKYYPETPRKECVPPPAPIPSKTKS